MNSCYEIRKLEEIYPLATTLSKYFPDSEKFKLAIVELLFNAVEHGNLAIGHHEKIELIRNKKLKDEYVKRLQQNPNKFVTLKMKISPKQIIIVIEDMGNGFDWKNLANIPQSQEQKPNGRGIYLAKLAFDKIIFRGRGNKCLCLYTRQV